MSEDTRVQGQWKCTAMAHYWEEGSGRCQCGDAKRHGDISRWAVSSRMSSGQIRRAVTSPSSATLSHPSEILADLVRSVVLEEIRDVIELTTFIDDMKEQIDDAISEPTAERCVARLASKMTDPELSMFGAWAVTDRRIQAIRVARSVLMEHGYAYSEEALKGMIDEVTK